MEMGTREEAQLQEPRVRAEGTVRMEAEPSKIVAGSISKTKLFFV
jgi:hypothetical protein